MPGARRKNKVFAAFHSAEAANDWLPSAREPFLFFDNLLVGSIAAKAKRAEEKDHKRVRLHIRHHKALHVWNGRLDDTCDQRLQ